MIYNILGLGRINLHFDAREAVLSAVEQEAAAGLSISLTKQTEERVPHPLLMLVVEKHPIWLTYHLQRC